MNPQTPETTPSLDLPTPQGDQAKTGAQAEQGFVDSKEQNQALAVEKSLSTQAAQLATPPQTNSAAPVDPISVSGQQPAIDPAGVSASMPAIADDNDLIEKEWVVKAKQIVAQTAKDPYTQNKELTKVKADYLQKRYNKSIKLAEN